MKKVVLSFVIVLFSLVSCKDSSKGTLHSETAVPVSSSGEYLLDITQSKINWTGYKIQKSLNLSHFGTIQFKEGNFNFKNNQLESGTFIADLSTLKDDDLEDPSQNKKLVDHLKDTDFLNVNTYPLCTFTIISSKNIDGVSDYNTEIKGTLKLKDNTKDIVIKANIRLENNMVFLNTEKFSVRRQDFELNYNGMGDVLINDDFDLQVSLVGKSK